MTYRCALCVVIALLPGTALGQLDAKARRSLTARPPRATLGQIVTLSVQGAASGAPYRYVAKMIAAPNALAPHVNCSQILGEGAVARWQAKSGTWRLTAYGPRGNEVDTLHVTYVVAPRTVMLATSQTPAQPAGVNVVLRTDDLGPGHQYQWWMQHATAVGNGNTSGLQWSSPWMTQTTSPMASYPTAISSSGPMRATVSIHRGDACDILAVGSKGP